MESNAVCNHTSDQQNLTTAKQETDLLISMISNGNWTEWSTIQGVIGRVISNRPSA